MYEIFRIVVVALTGSVVPQNYNGRLADRILHGQYDSHGEALLELGMLSFNEDGVFGHSVANLDEVTVTNGDGTATSYFISAQCGSCGNRHNADCVCN